jgi:hypothetical protein
MKVKMICLLVLFVIGAAVSNCFAADTHMGVEPADLVTLLWTCGDEIPLCLFRKSNHDGSLEPFHIPQRHVFVVTEFDWRFKEEGQVDISNMLEFSLERGTSPLDSTKQVRSYAFTKSIGCGSAPLCVSAFGASGSEQMTTGFVVVEGTLLRPTIGFAFNDEGLSTHSSKLAVTVRGYFAKPACGFNNLPPCRGR